MSEVQKFCAISPTVNADGIARTWKDTLDEATAHASRIIERSHARGSKKVRRLFVVQVVAVVETPRISLTVRDLAPGDVAPDVFGDDDNYTG